MNLFFLLLCRFDCVQQINGINKMCGKWLTLTIFIIKFFSWKGKTKFNKNRCLWKAQYLKSLQNSKLESQPASIWLTWSIWRFSDENSLHSDFWSKFIRHFPFPLFELGLQSKQSRLCNQTMNLSGLELLFKNRLGGGYIATEVMEVLDKNVVRLIGKAIPASGTSLQFFRIEFS